MKGRNTVSRGNRFTTSNRAEKSKRVSFEEMLAFTSHTYRAIFRHVNTGIGKYIWSIYHCLMCTNHFLIKPQSALREALNWNFQETGVLSFAQIPKCYKLDDETAFVLFTAIQVHTLPLNFSTMKKKLVLDSCSKNLIFYSFALKQATKSQEEF